MQPLETKAGFEVVAACDATHIHDRDADEIYRLSHWSLQDEAVVYTDEDTAMMRTIPTVRHTPDYLTVRRTD